MRCNVCGQVIHKHEMFHEATGGVRGGPALRVWCWPCGAHREAEVEAMLDVMVQECRGMIYQADLKREVAASKGLRSDVYDHWTYEEWKNVRDAYLVAEGRAISLEGAAEARRRLDEESETCDC